MIDISFAAKPHATAPRAAGFEVDYRESDAAHSIAPDELRRAVSWLAQTIERMTLVTDLELPSSTTPTPSSAASATGRRWPAVEGHDGWLAANPFGYTVLDHESGEFFLRTRQAVFPGLTIAEIFQISDGPLHEEIVKNIININGADHSRLRNLVNPALSPRAVERYRPAMRRFLAQLARAGAGRRSPRLRRRLRQALPVACDRRGDGRAAQRRAAPSPLLELDPAPVRCRQPDDRAGPDRSRGGRVLRLRGRAHRGPARSSPGRRSDLRPDRCRGPRAIA